MGKTSPRDMDLTTEKSCEIDVYYVHIIPPSQEDKAIEDVPIFLEPSVEAFKTQSCSRRAENLEKKVFRFGPNGLYRNGLY